MIDIPWPAPAKINLFLHITGRRSDGYHELQTLFQFLDLHDELWFEISEDGVIQRCSDIRDLPENDDLVIKAARRLRKEAGVNAAHLGVAISIHKKLPMGGGIGGGSSDAATTLVALNHLWGLKLSTDRLANIGMELGADVPVFIYGHAAWAEGIGEKLKNYEPEMPWYLLVHPVVHISTMEIFANSELTRDTTPIKMHTFEISDGQNDCEPIVRKLYPEVSEVFSWFGPGSKARLTGTGACVFCPYPDEEAARLKARTLPEKWSGYVTKGLNRSSLLDRLAKELNHKTK